MRFEDTPLADALSKSGQALANELGLILSGDAAPDRYGKSPDRNAVARAYSQELTASQRAMLRDSMLLLLEHEALDGAELSATVIGVTALMANVDWYGHAPSIQLRRLDTLWGACAARGKARHAAVVLLNTAQYGTKRPPSHWKNAYNLIGTSSAGAVFDGIARTNAYAAMEWAENALDEEALDRLYARAIPRLATSGDLDIKSMLAAPHVSDGIQRRLRRVSSAYSLPPAIEPPIDPLAWSVAEEDRQKFNDMAVAAAREVPGSVGVADYERLNKSSFSATGLFAAFALGVESEYATRDAASTVIGEGDSDGKP